MIATGRGVVQQFCRASNGGNHNVNFPIVVQIAESTPAVGCKKLRGMTCVAANILKCSIMHVAKHCIRLPVVLLFVQVGILAHMRVGRE